MNNYRKPICRDGLKTRWRLQFMYYGLAVTEARKQDGGSNQCISVFTAISRAVGAGAAGAAAAGPKLRAQKINKK